VIVASRVAGGEPRAGDAAPAGALAGIALALKPHFALVWLFVEVYARARNPTGWRRITPELAATVAIVSAYVVGVALFTPEYLRLAATLGPAYATYLRDPFPRLLLTGPGAALVLFSLLAAFAGRRGSSYPAWWALVGVAVVACFFAGAAQEKGLRYHFYPAFALAFVLLAIVAAEARTAASNLSERVYARASRVVLGTLAIVLVGRTVVAAAGGGPAQRRAHAESQELASLVRSHAAGGHIAVFSYNIRSAFPLVNYAGVTLASRFPHLWIFPVAYWDELHRDAPLRYRTPDQMTPQERYLFESVRADLLEAQPELLLILRPGRDLARNGLRRLHYVQYFGRDPDVAALFARYQLLAQMGEYDIYERLELSASRTAPPPTDAPGQGDARLARVTEVQLGLLDGELVAGVAVFLILWCGSYLLRWRAGAVRVA
jgi:hypothetical protein